MGHGNIYKCKECNYQMMVWDGIGFLFPDVYRKNMIDVKSGKYGQEAKELVENNENAAIDCENAVAYCKSCNEYKLTPKLDIYLPKDGYVSDKEPVRWTVMDELEVCDYVTGCDLRKHYKKVYEVKHICETCNGKLEVMRNFHARVMHNKIYCPICSGLIEMDENMEIMVD